VSELTYPLSAGPRDAVRAASGKRLSEITLDAVLAGDVNADDMRVSPETLALQADFAERGAERCAAMVREARAAYIRRGLIA
jgi:propanediol dehydratase small subunit